MEVRDVLNSVSAIGMKDITLPQFSAIFCRNFSQLDLTPPPPPHRNPPPKSVFTAHKKTRLWSPGICCFPLSNLYCRTTTLMLVRVQLRLVCSSARRSSFFSGRSSSTSSSAPQSVDSGLQVLSAPLVVSGAAIFSSD